MLYEVIAICVLICGFVLIFTHMEQKRNKQTVEMVQKALLSGISAARTETSVPMRTLIKEVSNEKEEEKVDKEQERLDTILANLENYDGTAKGQREIV